MSSSLRVFVAVKRKKKEDWVFLLPFPENKEYKENSEQVWTFLVFFTLTAPNSECLRLSLLFCPLTLQGLYFTPIFLWLCAKHKSPRQHPSPWSYTYQKEGRRATQLPDSITGLLTPVYDCLGNNARGRNHDPISFCPHRWLLNPCLIKAPGFLMQVGTQVLRRDPTVFPSPPCWE